MLHTDERGGYHTLPSQHARRAGRLASRKLPRHNSAPTNEEALAAIHTMTTVTCQAKRRASDIVRNDTAIRRFPFAERRAA